MFDRILWENFKRRHNQVEQPLRKKGLLHVGPKAARLDFLFLGDNYCLLNMEMHYFALFWALILRTVEASFARLQVCLSYKIDKFWPKIFFPCYCLLNIIRSCAHIRAWGKMRQKTGKCAMRYAIKTRGYAIDFALERTIIYQ